MLRNAKSLEGYELAARDGAIGRVKDIYFDDAEWRVRYFVVDAGSWLTDRSVLISAAALTLRGGIPSGCKPSLPVNRCATALRSIRRNRFRGNTNRTCTHTTAGRFIGGNQ